MNPFKNYPPFNEERAWSYLTPSYINMALNPFQPNPRGICCLLSRVFSSKNLIPNFMWKCYLYHLIECKGPTLSLGHKCAERDADA